MKAKHLLAVGIGFMAIFAILQLRIFALVLDANAGETARRQSTVTLSLYSGRADIYDCAMRPLTGQTTQQLVLAVPGDTGYAELYRSLTPAAAAELYAQNLAVPALVMTTSPLEKEELFTYTRPARYFTTPIAVHVLGYLDGEDNGAAGIEKSYNDLLSSGGEKTFVQCTTNAAGGLMENTTPQLTREPGTGLAVQLTLDERIQRLCEGAAQQLSSGAIVVMDSQSGQLRAVVSAPTYDPLNVGKSIREGDSSLVCRAFSAYSVGSVFKPLIAAAAIEAGYDETTAYDCTGTITVAGHDYHCASGHVHGQITMAQALEQSCNCYFIDLAKKIGPEALRNFALRCGFGRATPLWDGYASAAGNLPTQEELQLPGELASFGFGQGKLLATPVQLAAFYNAVANGGVYVAPTLVCGTVQADTGTLVTPGPTQESLRIMSDVTAKKLRKMLSGVITEGIASAAAPQSGSAAGKTGTAQTGRINEDGKEELDIWFAGFWPASAPRYTIVLLEDATTRNGEALAPVFAQLCDSLERLERWG